MKKDNSTKNKDTANIVPARLRRDAHTVLPDLCKILAAEKNMVVSYTDAGSIAILNEYRRAMRRQERRAQAQKATI